MNELSKAQKRSGDRACAAIEEDLNRRGLYSARDNRINQLIINQEPVINTDKLTAIQQTIEALTVPEYQTLSTWLKQHDNDRWDTQIENDAKAGRLDELINEARQEINEGSTKPL